MKLRLHLARLRLLRWGITATPLREGEYDTEIEGTPIRLSHSGFNNNLNLNHGRTTSNLSLAQPNFFLLGLMVEPPN